MARPAKLTDAVQARFIEALRQGNTRKTSAQYAGIHVSTLDRWMHDSRPAYRAFQEAVEKADADAEMAYVAIIKTAAQETWQAAAWWLERRRFQDWGRKDRVEHSTAPDAPLEVKHDASARLAGYLDTVARLVREGPPADPGRDGAEQSVDPGGPDAEAGGLSDSPGP